MHWCLNMFLNQNEGLDTRREAEQEPELQAEHSAIANIKLTRKVRSRNSHSAALEHYLLSRQCKVNSLSAQHSLVSFGCSIPLRREKMIRINRRKVNVI